MSFQYIGVNYLKGKEEVGLDKSKRTVIKIDKRYFRPNELHYLKGNQKKDKNLKWKPNISKRFN